MRRSAERLHGWGTGSVTGAPRVAAVPLAAAGAAALALLAIGHTAWAPLMHHGPAAGGGGHAAHAAPALASAAWLVGWCLMVVAMMLPAAVPLVRDVAGTGPAPGAARQRAFASAGYLGVWGASGLAVLGVLALAVDAPAGVVLAAVGLHQLSPLKRRALTACRSHARLLPPGWAGGPDPSGVALRAGVSHGLASVACCGPLMLAVTLVAMDQPLLMLVAACAMTAEAATPLGPRITRPAGAALLLTGLVAVALG